MADRERRGPLAYMARHRVAPNLLLLVLLAGGLVVAPSIEQEVFPELTLDFVTVEIPYPGADPEEVEQGVVLAVEEAARGIDGVETVRSVAAEGVGTVQAELFVGVDPQRVRDEIESAIGRITSFPREAERPIVSVGSNRREVVSLVVHGDLSRRSLHALAEQVRADLLRDGRVTVVDIVGLPPPIIAVEVPQARLRRYGLTLGEVAARVRAAAAADVPGGALETPGGEVLLRTRARRDGAAELARLPIVVAPDGTRVPLGDLATVTDGFRETGPEADREAWFDGQRAVRLRVYRVAGQSPREVSAAVRESLESLRRRLPPAVGVAIWNDWSEVYRDRVTLLLKNGALGAALVLSLLGLFLRPRLAFWVTAGMVASFVGALLFLPALDVTLNMISLFAFLLALGIVVDDAIVVGEAIHARVADRDRLGAAVAGVREVARPVVFAVLTTIIAFLPMVFVPGVSGKLFRNIPLVVIPILVISLVESLFILPSHLAHGRPASPSWQQRFSAGMERLIRRRYAPLVRALLRRRYLTLAAGVGLLTLTVGWVAGGRMAFDFLPKIEGDVVTASVELPAGARVEDTRRVVGRLVAAARAALEAAGGEDALSRGIYAEIGGTATDVGGPDEAASRAGGGHRAEVAVFLVPAGERALTASAFTRAWRRRAGEIPGVERLAFHYGIGPPAGAEVALELSHPDPRTLERAAGRLAGALATYAGVSDIDDGFDAGVEQVDLVLRPGARALGLSDAALGRQVRHAFHGAEALRRQRGREELRVMVRRPAAERDSLHHLEDLVIRTPGGGEVPLAEAARVVRTRAPMAMRREGGRRVARVTADVDPRVTTGDRVMAHLEADVLPALGADFPGLRWERAGEAQEQDESLAALGRGSLLALFAMYALMALAFRSYAEPLIVLLAIPFGLMGAIAGHLLMGHGLSLISLLGMIALAGVVVNDALVLIAAIHERRRGGEPAIEAVTAAAVRRFRPILLTSLTTFFGLAPMIVETSVQARFLIPMAIALGIGVLFVTPLVLTLVPAAWLALDDLRRAARRRRRGP